MTRTTARPLISVVAPAYNEDSIVEPNLARVCAYMDSYGGDVTWELIVVDDGSSDETARIAREFAASRENVHVHRHPINLGLGHALRSGFTLARGDYIVTIDIDLTYAPEHIGALFERLRDTGADIALASPYMKAGRASGIPWLRRVMSRWGNRFLALTARGVSRGGNISTLTGMVRAYRRRFINSVNLISSGMEINTEIIYKAMILGARIEEVPAHLDWSRQHGAQSVRTSSKRIRRGIVFALLAGFIIRPFAFFIVPALAAGVVSAYVLAWISIHVVRHYRVVVQSGEPFDLVFSESLARAFAQAPHAFVVGGITILLALQLFSLGVLALQAKHYFEELFHFGTRLDAQSRELQRLVAERDAGEEPLRGEDG